MAFLSGRQPFRTRPAGSGERATSLSATAAGLSLLGCLAVWAAAHHPNAVAALVAAIVVLAVFAIVSGARALKGLGSHAQRRWIAIVGMTLGALILLLLGLIAAFFAVWAWSVSQWGWTM